MPLDGDHCNGSVNLDDAESVMGEIVSPIPVGLRRIPDGETGEQANWVFVQLRKFPQLRWLVPARPQRGSLAGLAVDPGTELSSALLLYDPAEQARGTT
jgi:hypothetical protein